MNKLIIAIVLIFAASISQAQTTPPATPGSPTNPNITPQNPNLNPTNPNYIPPTGVTGATGSTGVYPSGPTGVSGELNDQRNHNLDFNQPKGITGSTGPTGKTEGTLKLESPGNTYGQAPSTALYCNECQRPLLPLNK